MKKLYEVIGISERKYSRQVATSEKERDEWVADMVKWHDTVTVTEFVETSIIRVKP